MPQPPATRYLKDYQPPAFLIERVALCCYLFEQGTRVEAHLWLRRNPAGPGGPLVLDGEGLTTHSLSMDGRRLSADEYRLEPSSLTLDAPDGPFVLESEVEIAPERNSALEGLYRSQGMFCTQCEAEGFRRITWYLDRPDVMATFRVRIEADLARYPVLLCNGNPVDRGTLADGRHFAVWDDPFPKPCYLFALVAGDLAHIEDQHCTPSGRQVRLRIYTEAENISKCDHAMRSLKRAMGWDEQRYGRECDLEVYNIVAVNDFNMGAMENKGLNIFNAKYVLARPETATDADYQGIEGVIAHEYFHNWTGNRITCRDWFQLSLKEGLTVYRDQEFSADMGSRAVKRVEDARLLRSHQFAEDAGPMAHPVRPASYMEINNFYTLTVYEKGAELVRMLALLLGPEPFRRATDLYFARHDGQAVTTDDFLRCMADASGRDLGQFSRWYELAGTPALWVEGQHLAASRQFRLQIRQELPDTPGQRDKPPLHIPFAVGLLGPDGTDLLPEGTRLLELTEREQTIVFDGIDRPPVPSLLRGFSAPVKLRYAHDDGALRFLMAHDSDGFNRWDAAQELSQRLLLGLVAASQAGRPMRVPEDYLEAFRRTLLAEGQDQALLAEALLLPSESYLGEQMAEVDVDGLHAARTFARQWIGQWLREDLLRVYARNQDGGSYQPSAGAIAQRQLKNLALGYLMASGGEDGKRLCLEQFRARHNMTDTLAALALLADGDLPERDEALSEFYRDWRHDPLVLDKWLAVQAGSSRPDTLERVRALLDHPAFSIRNPNKVRALIGAFCGNPVRFHRADGAGYRFLADQVLQLDPLNPQVAARLLRALSRWRRYDSGRQSLMAAELRRVLGQPGLSRDCHEIAAKSLAEADGWPGVRLTS